MLFDSCKGILNQVFEKHLRTSIHPLSAAYPGGQQTQQADPGFPLTRDTVQLTLGDPEALPGQLGDMIPPACRGLSLGLLPDGRAWGGFSSVG